MALSLTISQARGGADRQTRLLSRGTMSIGRASGNDWVLADPDQHLSRTHCQISFENGFYYLTDRSTNGMLVNGATTPTTRDFRLQLNDGDTILLGSYKMVVTEIEEPEAASPFGGNSFVGGRVDPFASAGGHGEGNPLDIDPFEDKLGLSEGFSHPMVHTPPTLRMADPFDALERDKPADQEADMFRGKAEIDPFQGPAQREQQGAISNAWMPPKATVAPAAMSDMDFDALLGDLMPGAVPAAAAPVARPSTPPEPDPFAALLGDNPFEEPAPPARPASVMAPPPTVALPTVAPPVVAPPVVAQPEPAPATVSPPAPVLPSPTAMADTAALLQAFLEGAGLPKSDFGAADPVATMRALGALFRAFTSGTRDVLISRAEIKHEMRVEQTMIRSRDNNALKFSISPDEAMLALLRPDRPGYKPPLPSVEEAFEDIRSHEMALMAGMQTGMMALLKRFDPAALEERLQPGRLDSILPAARKARFWEMFCATYKDIAREAADDFQAVFGRDFARAYNEQIRKL
jgi:type VI secretion system protein